MKKKNDFYYRYYEDIRLRVKNSYLRFHVTSDYKKELAELDKTIYREIDISGLHQESFEYFILNYAEKFTIIRLVHCNLIRDFTCLETLEDVTFITIDWNNKATKLWNMSRNFKLKSLYFLDVKKITDFTEVTTAPKLVEIAISESTNSKLGKNHCEIETLQPFQDSKNLKRIFLTVEKIKHDGITPLLEMNSLDNLHLSSHLFTLEEFAYLNAKLENTVVIPNKPYYIYQDDDWVLVVGRRRNLKKSSKKLEQLQLEWDHIIKSSK